MNLLVYLTGLVVIACVAVAVAWPLLRPARTPSVGPIGDPVRYRWEKEKDLRQHEFIDWSCPFSAERGQE